MAEIRQSRERAATRARQALAEAESKRAKDTKPSLALEKYAGAYADSANGTMTVAMKNGKLVLKYRPEFTGDLEHWNYDTLRARWRSMALFSHSFVSFALDRDGRVAAIEVDQFGKFGVAR